MVKIFKLDQIKRVLEKVELIHKIEYDFVA